MKKFLIISGLILLVLFSVPICINVHNFANILGIAGSALLCLYGKFFTEFNSFVKSLWKKIYGKVILIPVCIICCAIIITIGIITGLMISASVNSSPENTTVVVLGCKVNPDGPSISLLTRLEATLEYLTENKDAVCVLSGGQGTDETMSEAQAMYNWLTERGIDQDRLYIEDKSTSTRENLLFSQEIIEKNGLCRDITIITNEFHLYRAGKIAEKLGITAYGYSAKTPFYLLPTYYVRELFAIASEFVLN